jgi:hypothetical protein
MKRYSISIILSFVLFVVLVSSADAQVGRGKFGFGLSAAGNMLKGDWKTTDPGYGVNADLSYALGYNLGLLGTFGFDAYSGKTSLDQRVLSTTFQVKLAVTYDFLPQNLVNPFLFGGGGIVHFSPRFEDGDALTSGRVRSWDFAANGGVGVDIFLNESWSAVLMGEVVLTRNEQVDGIDAGAYYDAMTRVSIGVRYYLFDRSTVQRIVNTLTR